MHFKQFVDFITCPISKSCLDHIYCNQPQRIKNISTHNIGLSDHLPIFVVRMYARENVDRNNNGLYIKYRNMKCLDVNRSKESLERAPWDTAFLFDDVDDICLCLGKHF